MKSKKNSKSDLRKKSPLFLQLALILVLLLSYVSIEWKTYAKGDDTKQQLFLQQLEDEVIPITVLQTPPPPAAPLSPEIIEIIDDKAEKEEDPVESTEIDGPVITDIGDIIESPLDEPIEEIPFFLIESVPVYPGCENLETNEQKRQCMSEKINKFVNRNFDTSLGNKLGLTGVNRVHVMFKIDREGNITEVQSRAPHPKLEEEAKRVINALPNMQPGKQRGKAVNVSYSLPIIFQVQD